MARNRKSKCKDGTSPRKAADEVADAGQTSKAHDKGKKAHRRKRKSVSEKPQTRKRSKRYKKIKSSSSLELISVLPCCPSEKERKKYAKLGLDSALFFSSSTPAKRKQSHISVITISSSDDEDLNNDKTADWISKMDLGQINTLSNEEPFPSGDADFSQSVYMSEETLDAEKYRPRRSSTRICSTPVPTFKPLSASTPQGNLSIFQPLCHSTPETGNGNLLIYNGPSFLENPLKSLRQNSTALTVIGNPQTIESTKISKKEGECEFNPVSTSGSCYSKFYFGQPQNLKTLQPTFENSESKAPMWSDLSYFNFGQTSNLNANSLAEESVRHETEAKRYSLEQVPSTSRAPVSDPVLEVPPRKKKSKSRNNNPSSSR